MVDVDLYESLVFEVFVVRVRPDAADSQISGSVEKFKLNQIHPIRMLLQNLLSYLVHL